MGTTTGKNDFLPVQANITTGQSVFDDQALAAGRCRLWKVSQAQIDAAGCLATKGRCVRRG